MASRPRCWLGKEILEQLLLGYDWLEHKNKAKQSGEGPKAVPDPERGYRGLYHDNGSCLDITNDLDDESESNGYLKIIEARERVLPPVTLQCGPSNLT